MFKTTVIALIAATSMVSVAAPAFADTENRSYNDQNEDAGARAFYGQSLVARLHDKGIEATSVESWGGLVRAYVIDADGRQTMQFFTPDTLTQVVL